MLYSVSNIDHVMFACVRNCADTNESLTELGFVAKVLPLHRPDPSSTDLKVLMKTNLSG